MSLSPHCLQLDEIRPPADPLTLHTTIPARELGMLLHHERKLLYYWVAGLHRACRRCHRQPSTKRRTSARRIYPSHSKPGHGLQQLHGQCGKHINADATSVLLNASQCNMFNRNSLLVGVVIATSAANALNNGVGRLPVLGYNSK